MALDTSALMAILLDEPAADWCAEVMEREAELCISAGTLAEALLVAAHRGLEAEMTRLLAGNAVEVVDVTAARAHRVATSHTRWGKGVHSAGLNFGDCFAYALATERACALLFVGDDFARTDVTSVNP